jgi:hypothetical protein
MIPLLAQSCGSQRQSYVRSQRKPTSGGWTAIRVTHMRHWLCTAAMVLMEVSAPIKVLV